MPLYVAGGVLRLTRSWLIRAVAMAAAAAIMLVASASGAYAGGHHGHRGDLAAARAATAKFHRLKVATDAGYSILADKDGITCIDMHGMGAMGVHYVKGDLVADPSIKARHPEALVYAPDRHGRLHLAALEYVVIKADWDATHANPPELFGQEFNFTDAGNRYGLPAFYSLHVWLWKHNPAGTFEMWNPRVHCHCT